MLEIEVRQAIRTMSNSRQRSRGADMTALQRLNSGQRL
jgi:hypothetical protein